MFDRGDQPRIREVGFSMLDMRTYLEQRGFRADGLRLSLDRLAGLNVPAIALITPGNYRHFVVVKGVTDTHVLVGDPTFGLQTYTRADFEAVWNGVVLAIRQTPDGVEDPIYNAENEWQPWSRAPLGDAQGPVSPSTLFLSARELYQVTPLTPPVPG
jgi:predicted double-glycine peptidase